MKIFISVIAALIISAVIATGLGIYMMWKDDKIMKDLEERGEV